MEHLKLSFKFKSANIEYFDRSVCEHFDLETHHLSPSFPDSKSTKRRHNNRYSLIA